MLLSSIAILFRKHALHNKNNLGHLLFKDSCFLLEKQNSREKRKDSHPLSAARPRWPERGPVWSWNSLLGTGTFCCFSGFRSRELDLNWSIRDLTLYPHGMLALRQGLHLQHCGSSPYLLFQSNSEPWLFCGVNEPQILWLSRKMTLWGESVDINTGAHSCRSWL